MTNKQKILSIFPDAKAVQRTANRRPKFPRRMIRSAPRHHFLRKKYARHLKGKWHYVEICMPSLRYDGTETMLSVGNSEVEAWQRAVLWYWVEDGK